jgi:hypothetical protein
MSDSGLSRKRIIGTKAWLMLGLLSGLLMMFVMGRFDNIDYRNSDNLNILRLKHSGEFDAIDMLFVGSSLVYNSIDPEIFSEQGFSIYNLGSPSAGPLFYQLITEDYLAAVKTPPKRILMHIDRVTFSPVVDNWREYRVHRYLNTPLSNEALVLRFGTYGDYPKLFYNSAEMGLRNLVRWISGYYGSVDRPDVNRGFQVSAEIMNKEVIKKQEPYMLPLRKAVFDPAKARYFLAYIKELRARGFDVVLFELPTNLLPTYFSAAYAADYRELKAELGREGFVVIPNELELGSEFYRNIDHLNARGAKVLSRDLLDTLVNL